MTNSMEKTYRPVADNDDDETACSTRSEDESFLLSDAKARRTSSRARRLWVAVGGMLSVVVYTAVVVMATRRSLTAQTEDPRIIRSPAADYVKYEVRELDYLNWDQSSAYFGPPSEEVDSNWHELVRYHNIGVTEGFMQQLGRVDQGVRFPDGRYMASMMVFHHLHCLKHIYHTLNAEHYGLANKSAKEAAAWTKHTEHCLGALKAYVMCAADSSMETMLWDEHKALPLHNVTSTRQCVRWDSLVDYARDNNVDVFAEGQLVHPVMGPVFKDGKQILPNS